MITGYLKLKPFVFLFGYFAQACTQPLPTLPCESLATITSVDLRDHLTYLASDDLGGRHSFSPGNRDAAEYLKKQLESYGYRGAAPGNSFFQRVPVSRHKVDISQSGLTLRFGHEVRELNYETDYMPERPNQMIEKVSGEMVFVGYGVSSPGNDYDDYANVDVKGKFVITLKAIPEQLKGVHLEDREVRNQAAIAHGALGNVVVSAGLLSAYARFSFGYSDREFVRLYDESTGRHDPIIGMGVEVTKPDESLQLILSGPGLVAALAQAMGKEESYLTEPNGEPRPPEPLSAALEVRTVFKEVESGDTYNVLGILEGSDPQLKDEYIVISAHYDGVGGADNRVVYNAANDNASGTAAVLEIAQALTEAPRPKRSTLIAFYTAEELGLVGSRFNTEYQPVIPLEKIVANLDFDMVGHSGEQGSSQVGGEIADSKSVFIIGADKLSTELDMINQVTNTQTVRLRLDYSLNDPARRDRIFFRSDHTHYMRHGIPVIWYYTGSDASYHTPQDDLEKIDFAKMERIARLGFATAWRVAELDHRVVADQDLMALFK